MIDITDNTLMRDISNRFVPHVGELTVKTYFDRICEMRDLVPGFPVFVAYDDFKRYLQIVEDNRNPDLGSITKDSRIVPIYHNGTYCSIARQSALPKMFGCIFG